MTSKEVNLISMTVATILAMSNEAREELWDQLRKHYCMGCGEKTEGGTCWTCYDSRPE